jgi:hypothetical protein
MNNIFSKIALVSAIVLLSKTAEAQCGATECFVKGDYVEVGVSRTGAYGANP